jgi:hypothetical protein
MRGDHERHERFERRGFVGGGAMSGSILCRSAGLGAIALALSMQACGQSPSAASEPSAGGAVPSDGLSAAKANASVLAPALLAVHAEQAARTVRATRQLGAALVARLDRPLRALSATLPTRADQPATLRVGDVEASLDMTPLDAARAPSPGAEALGLTVYPDAARGADRVVHAGGDVFEELWVLRTPDAPHAYRLHVAAGAAIASVRVREGRIELVDAHGKVRLSSGALVAEDAKGHRRTLTLDAPTSTRAGDLDVVARLDTAGMELPIVIDPAWSVVQAMNRISSATPAYTLASGRVLVVQGNGRSEYFDPATGTWTDTGAMVNSAYSDGYQSASVNPSAHLSDDTVLLADPYGANSERYFPATNAWAAASTPPSRAFRAMSPITGGALAACGGATTAADVFSLTTGGWAPTTAMNLARTGCSAVTLANGSVLVVGGGNTTAEIYTPSTKKWALAGAMSIDRTTPIAVLLPTGKVMIAGGVSGNATTDIYDPVANKWTVGASMAAAHTFTSGVMTTNGKLVVAGGVGLDVAEQYDPTAGTWTTLPHMISVRKWPSIAAMPNGQVLAAGGLLREGSTTVIWLASAEIFGEPLGTACASALECGSGNCVDGVCCATATCGAGSYCNTPTKTGTCAKPIGSTCAADAECALGLCVDKVCCASACGGQCQACDVPGHVGACFPVLGVPHGTRTACGGVGAGTSCGASCDGTDGTKCNFAGSSVTCDATTCATGIETHVSTCAGNGTCKDSSHACGAYACSTNACKTSCANRTDCAAGYACKASLCVPLVGLGTACASASECASGFCTDGVCCGVAICGVGGSCALGAAPGTCAKRPGVACTTNAECGNGSDGSPHCVDGVCCDRGCDGQCEACDVKGKFGTCSAVVGLAHGARTACDAGGGDTCKATSCDGADTTKCASFVNGTSTLCAPASCAVDTFTNESSCDGSGTCAAPPSQRCAPYRCDKAGCFTSCSKDAQCTDGFACSDGKCQAIVARCTDDHSGSIATDGTLSSCAPYRCTTLGACGSSCATSDDCALGGACDPATKLCSVEAPTATPSSGCAASHEGGTSGAGAATALAFALALHVRRRRARRQG